MRYRQLGREGPQVSEIGFGTWGLGGTHQGAVAYGPTDDTASKLALSKANSLGINFYDTSDLYGHGHSEQLLGEVFQNLHLNTFIATKGGFVDAKGAQDFSISHLEAALEKSLGRLKTSCVALFQLHSPPITLVRSNRKILECLQGFKRSGKARCIGVSVRSPEEGLEWAEYPLDVLQVNYNLTDQRAAEVGLFDLCLKKGIGVIIRTPLCFGFLTGAFAGQETFAANDHRSRWPSEQRRRWNDALEIFKGLVRACEGQSPAQFALRFCLSQPAVSTVIPGMLTAAHVDENARASKMGPLSSEELLKIEALYKATPFFLGKPPG